MLERSHNHWEPLCASPGAILDMSGRGKDGRPAMHAILILASIPMKY